MILLAPDIGRPAIPSNMTSLSYMEFVRPPHVSSTE